MRQPLTILLASIEALLFAGQLTTLASTYWTSWDLRINWTQTLGSGDVGKRPPSDGQLISQGHAGLWSRCVRVHGTGKDFNDSRLNADKCLSNFDDVEKWENFKYGKTCKLATAGLCVMELLITCTLFCLLLISACCQPKKRKRCIQAVKIILLVIQGIVAALIPVLYLAGNMAELVEQLTSAYGLLLVVYLEAWYIHDWAYWLQVSLALVWALSAGLYSLVQTKERRSSHLRGPVIIKHNGGVTDTPELESLHIQSNVK